MFEDKVVKCEDCNKEFTWTAREQEFLSERGFLNPPLRCKKCDMIYKKNKMKNK